MVDQERPAESIRQILARIQQKRARIAAGDSVPHDRSAEGATSDDTPASAPGPVCVRCSDRGWFTPDVAVGHQDFGKVVYCSCGREQLQTERLRRLRIFSNLGNLARYTFSSIQPDRYEGTDGDMLFRSALDRSRLYSRVPVGWFVLTGPPSTGKTHLAASIVNALLENGTVTLYLSVPDLLDQLRPDHAVSPTEGYTFTYEQITNVPVLVLDDLGRQYATDWAQEKLHQVLNYRFNAMLPTVFAVEGSIDDLDSVLVSRFADEDVVTVVRTGVQRPEGADVWLPSNWMLEHMRLDDFKVFGPTACRTERQEALSAAELFARKPSGWLVFCGPTGVGKTHLASGITEALYRDHDIIYVRVQQMLNTLLNSIRSSSAGESFLDKFTRLSEVDVLVLDNLGSENETRWNSATLEELLVARHDARLPTVVTTSHDMRNETGPIASRLTDISLSSVFVLSGDDFRRRAVED